MNTPNNDWNPSPLTHAAYLLAGLTAWITHHLQRKDKHHD